MFDRVHGMHEAVEILRKQVDELSHELRALRAENFLLRQKNDLLLRRLFGSKSEKLDSKQMELLLGALTQEIKPDDDPTPPSGPPRPRGKRDRTKPRLPENLPVEEIVIDPPEVQQKPEDYRCIGQEVTEELDVTPTRYFRRRIIRRKYTSKKNRDKAPVIAKQSPRLIDNSYASVGLVVDVILQKYEDHIPLYRQERILNERYGIELPRKTMCDWMGTAANWCKPIYRLIAEGVRSDGYMQVDETPVKYSMAEGGGSGQGYFWVYNRPGGDVFFEWHTSRAADCLDGMLKDFKGTVQCDAYLAYSSYANSHKDIELSGCWGHLRRRFHEAIDESSRLAGWVLNQIGRLYEVEAGLRSGRAGPALRQVARSSQSRMVLNRLQKALKLKLLAHLPQSRMGKAISYALSNWDELQRYCDNGKIEIDNNLVENAIRPTAVGKKNWLFIGHPDAGERSAILYTLIECCRRRCINTREYLTDIFTRLPAMKMSEVATLTPENWLAARTAKAA